MWYLSTNKSMPDTTSDAIDNYEQTGEYNSNSNPNFCWIFLAEKGVLIFTVIEMDNEIGEDHVGIAPAW